mmetsp:Transcript_25571/g.55014  ORF Transcript_25571/g.55014 Transcript_25571/m.55014 type:complete len:146 (+) Transcript_25571:101-538(+)|eukprot:CAMPEP_0172308594 /NCGR_PEP_ID=MMETSP1058-20130122/9135_1 /TAXON_ID=83371 /ORGANISM="Detonula confervacea, Strain CCMP 353" /LENGTH=145 /DNA_ID=CAMNT_0013021043 /DNA_START=74 /DNA_END=511 /DNA_ORIENTATION=+
MKYFSAITAFLVAALTKNTILAFSPAVSSRLSTRLLSTADNGRIKKAGAGITTQTPGDLCSYDPNEQGLMQGSNTLMDRLESGASFTLSGAQDISPSAPAPATPTAPTPPTPEPTAETSKSFTNLTQLLKGNLDGRFGGGGRSQY